MVFILEKLSDEDRINYHLHKEGKSLQRDRWVIDRDNNKYLIYDGVDPDSQIETFYLIWKGKNIRSIVSHSLAVTKSVNTGGTLNNIEYIPKRLYMPACLEKHIEEIKLDLEKSLCVYGWNGSPKYTGDVLVSHLDSVEIYFDENIRIN